MRGIGRHRKFAEISPQLKPWTFGIVSRILARLECRQLHSIWKKRVCLEHDVLTHSRDIIFLLIDTLLWKVGV